MLNSQLTINPNDAFLLNYRGMIYQAIGLYEESIADFSKSLEIDPNDITSLSHRGVTYQKMGLYDEALADFDEFLEIMPNNFIALNNRGSVMQMMGMYEESLIDLTRSLEINPNYANTLQIRGLTYQKMGSYEESLLDFNKLLVEISPNDATGLNHRGLTYYYMGRDEESLNDFNKSLEIEYDVTTLANRGATYLRMGKYEESLVDLNEYLKIYPNAAKSLCIRGIIYQKLGKYEESLIDLNNSLRIDPENEETLDNRRLTCQYINANLNESFESLEISSNDTMEVFNYRGTGVSWYDSELFRSKRPIPQCELFYFEVKIIDKGDNGIIGIGFCTETAAPKAMPGWGEYSWGYRGDNGKIFCHSRGGKSYGPLFTTGDIIGCCLNFRLNIIFYTKNGVNLGIAFKNFKMENKTLYPCVGLRSECGSVEMNFGSKKFKYKAITDYDIKDKLFKEKWNRVFNMYNDELLSKQADALAELIDASKVDPMYRGKTYFITGSYNEALSALDEQLEIEQNNTFALRYQGETLYMIERYEDARDCFEKLLLLNDAWALMPVMKLPGTLKFGNSDMLELALNDQSRGHQEN
ncbi:hypothetical protein C2G38_2168728 [Gigaspora rosea]|uniref:B30.2/SPRY domain-containing protein n=1 Tax=Gigaspora rosea TaxID=44941 RepID=A0A397VSR3_9GLOM|nr:hypothetical protein C2G38_2168728 [Gigaspora rosea]